MNAGIICLFFVSSILEEFHTLGKFSAVQMILTMEFLLWDMESVSMLLYFCIEVLYWNSFQQSPLILAEYQLNFKMVIWLHVWSYICCGFQEEGVTPSAPLWLCQLRGKQIENIRNWIWTCDPAKTSNPFLQYLVYAILSPCIEN